MNPPKERHARLKQLLAGYLAGSLSEGERQELVDEMRADEALAREVRSFHRQDRMLDTLFNMRRDESFVDRTLACAQYSDSREAFADRVWKRTQPIDDIPEGAGSDGSAFVKHKSARSRVFRPVWLAAAASLLLVVGLATFRMQAPDGAGHSALARITELTSGVQLRRAGAVIDAVTGMAIQPGDRVETGCGQMATLGYDREATRIELLESSAMVVGADGGAKRIRIESGAIRAQVAPQPRGRPLEVVTPHARAEVLGTELAVSVEDELTRLNVTQGRVRLMDVRMGRSIDVAAGFYAKAGKDVELEARPIPRDGNVRYVPGRILFREDFGRGLTNWNILQSPGKPANSKFVLAGEAVARHVEIEEVERGGRTVPCMTLRLDADSDFSLGVRLKHKVRAPAYSVEWLKRFVVSGTVMAPVCPETTNYRETYRMDERKKPAVGVGEWLRNRIDLVPISNATMTNAMAMDNFVKGIRIQTLHVEFERGAIMLNIHRGHGQVGGVTVRELVAESP